MIKINQLREEVDVLDSQILYLISKRMKLVKELALQKRKTGFPLVDKKREKQMINIWMTKAKYLDIEKKSVQHILKEILEMSKEAQSKTIK